MTSCFRLSSRESRNSSGSLNPYRFAWSHFWRMLLNSWACSSSAASLVVPVSWSDLSWRSFLSSAVHLLGPPVLHRHQLTGTPFFEESVVINVKPPFIHCFSVKSRAILESQGQSQPIVDKCTKESCGIGQQLPSDGCVERGDTCGVIILWQLEVQFTLLVLRRSGE
jgi:hypothetical protein